MMLRILLPVLCVVLFFSATAQINLQNGLVACYSFSGNAGDGSGNHHDATVFGATLTADRFGNPNSAYSFDGTDKISIPPAPVLSLYPITVATWMYITTNVQPGEAQMIFTMGDPGGFNGITITNLYATAEYSGLGIGGFDANHVPDNVVATPSVPPSNTWIHVVMEETPDSVILYVNGAQIGRVTEAAPPYYYQRNPGVAYLGLRTNETQGFKGIIDDVVIYNRALSAAEVKSLYMNGIPCIAPPPPPQVQDIANCGPGALTLTASGGTSYKWYDAATGGNLLFSGNPFVTPVIASTTSYYVTNVVSGIESTRTKATVTIYPSGPAICNFTDEPTAGVPANFSISVDMSTPPVTYMYNFGDGTTLTTTTAGIEQHVYRAPGDYGVTMNLIDANGCADGCGTVIHVRAGPKPANLIACYSFSGNANDGSGESHDGTVAGAQLAPDRFGNPSSAYLFTGMNEVDLPADVFTPYLNFSYSTWAYILQNPDPGNVETVISIGFPHSGPGFSQTLANHYGSAGLTGWGTGGSVQGGTTSLLETGVLPSEKVWFHLVTTRDDDSTKFYINGQRVGAVASHGFPAIYYENDSCVAKIGLRSNGIQGFHGIIDDVTIYDGALTATQVMSLFKNGAPCVVPPPPKIFIPNVITVNGDTLNKIFSAYLVEANGTYSRYNGSQTFELKVFNRWGDEIFRSDDSANGWDGTDSEPGVYYYHILVGEEKFKGWVSVVR